jgi:hypothetical protein
MNHVCRISQAYHRSDWNIEFLSIEVIGQLKLKKKKKFFKVIIVSAHLVQKSFFALQSLQIWNISSLALRSILGWSFHFGISLHHNLKTSLLSTASHIHSLASIEVSWTVFIMTCFSCEMIGICCGGCWWWNDGIRLVSSTTSTWACSAAEKPGPSVSQYLLITGVAHWRDGLTLSFGRSVYIEIYQSTATSS